MSDFAWMTQHLHSVILAAGVMCFIAGFLPFIGAELIVAIAAIKVRSFYLMELAAVAAFSMLLSKVIVYFLGVKAVKILPRRQRLRLYALRKRYGKRGYLKSSLVFSSSLVGLPPLYVINVLCGILKTSLRSFMAYCFLGTFVRFIFIALLPMFFVKLFS